MKLEKLVCSLKLSKKLKELGVKQDSLWYYREPNNDLVIGNTTNLLTRISAFSVGELGIILNRIFKKNPMMDISDKEYIKLVGKAFRFEDEANVRAKMLIHLIVKEFIKI